MHFQRKRYSKPGAGFEANPQKASSAFKFSNATSSPTNFPEDSFLASAQDSETICQFSCASTGSNTERHSYLEDDDKVGPITATVQFSYQPVLADELAIEPGDKVIVQHSFDDGWAVGLHLLSRKVGAFPLACLQATPVVSQPTSHVFSPHAFARVNAAPIARRVSSQRISRFISRF
ncbi:hypothetical protein L0F63_006070 [Massospora cicadina]|nr:hypothetical protein L0F63_006070 [Massospora cicadina]